MDQNNTNKIDTNGGDITDKEDAQHEVGMDMFLQNLQTWIPI